MKQFIFTITFIIGSLSMAIYAQTPGGVGGLTAWWSAVENKAHIDWKDNLNESTLQSICDAPSSMINFNPAFQFCPEVQLADILLGQAALTIIAVAFPNNSTEQSIWSLTHEDASQYMLTNQRLADLNQNAYINFTSAPKIQPFLYTYLGEVQPKENKKNASQFQIAQHTRADVPAQAFSGAIAEILIYDHVLTSLERNKVESALAIKYGLSTSTFQSPNYVASDETIIWDGIVDTDFSNQIAGIGRDLQSDLYQKQSSSSVEGAILTIAANHKANSNKGNNTIIDDHSFLVWGSNDEVMQLIDQNKTVMPFAKEWRIKNTNCDSVFTTSVYLDLSTTRTYVANDESLYLMIDRSGSGAYHINDCEYYSIDNSRDELSVNNINWDTDGSGTDQFRLAIAPKFFGKYSIDEVACGSNNKAKIYLGAEGGTAPYYFSFRDEMGTEINWEKRNNAIELLENVDAGLYHYIVADAQGQTFTETIIIENKSTSRTELIDEIILSENDVEVLDPSDYGFIDYTWVAPDGSVKSNEVILFSEVGLYTLLAKHDDCINKYVIMARSNDHLPSIEVEAFPNPTADGRFTAIIDCGAVSTIEYQLTSMDGKVIQQTSLNGRTNYQFQSNIPAKGQYIISIKNREHIVSKSIVYQ